MFFLHSAVVDISDPNGNWKCENNSGKNREKVFLKENEWSVGGGCCSLFDLPTTSCCLQTQVTFVGFFIFGEREILKSPTTICCLQTQVTFWFFLHSVCSTILRREKEISKSKTTSSYVTLVGIRDIFTCLSISFQAASEGLCSALLTLALLALSVRCTNNETFEI